MCLKFSNFGVPFFAGKSFLQNCRILKKLLVLSLLRHNYLLTEALVALETKAVHYITELYISQYWHTVYIE